LFMWLRSIVNGLHALSTCATLDIEVSLVSPRELVISPRLYFNPQLLGVPTGKSSLFWHWCSTQRPYLLLYPLLVLYDIWVC
jgi:hypothetical protein